MRRGTTLSELLVVMGIWAAIMSAVLGFYVYGTRVSQRYDALSQQLREVQQLYDRMVGRLTHAVVLEVVLGNQPAIRYVRSRSEAALRPEGLLPNWTDQDEILAIVPDPVRLNARQMELHGTADSKMCFYNRLVLQEEGRVSTLLQLTDGMLVSFEPAAGAVLMQVKVPVRNSQQRRDLKNVDIASMYADDKWRKVTRGFLLNGWAGAKVLDPAAKPPGQ